MIGQKFFSPSGFMLEMQPNQYLSKPVFIGQIRADGQFDVVWKTPGPIPGVAWSPYIPKPNGA